MAGGEDKNTDRCCLLYSHAFGLNFFSGEAEEGKRKSSALSVASV